MWRGGGDGEAAAAGEAGEDGDGGEALGLCSTNCREMWNGLGCINCLPETKRPEKRRGNEKIKFLASFFIRPRAAHTVSPLGSIILTHVSLALAFTQTSTFLLVIQPS